MKINKTFSYRLKPTLAQQEQLLQQAGAVRFVYNQGLALIKERMEKKEKIPSKYDLSAEVKNLRVAHPFLKDAISDSMKQSLFDLDKAMKAFFRRCKAKGEAPGFPRFRCKDIYNSMKYGQTVKCDNNGRVFIPKIGWIKYWDSRDIEGQIKLTIVNKKGKYWYVHLSCEIDKVNESALEGQQRSSESQNIPWIGQSNQPSKVNARENVKNGVFIEGQQIKTEGHNQNKSAFAIHLGIENFGYTSEGRTIDNPRFLQRDLKRLAHLQKKHSRKKKGSANRKKSVKKLAVFCERIANRRKDFLHKLSTVMVKNHDVIVLQAYNMKKMIADTQQGPKKRNLARSLHDVGWATFRSMIDYKCKWYDKTYIEIPAAEPSAQQCAHCGVLKDMPLNKRFYDCESCGVKIHRGVNAALNLRAAGLAVLNACGGMSASSPVEAGIS